MKFAFEHALPSVLVRVERPTGECVLQKRVEGGVVYELILNGKLLMDSREHASEEALAEIGLGACSGDQLEVLVGGLGFGFTLQAVLRDTRVARATVIELEPLLVALLSRDDVRADMAVPDLTDHRVCVHEGNVRDWIAASASSTYDLILLDVDNGPESVSAIGNVELYSEAGLRQAKAVLRRGGVLAVWSSEPAPQFLRSLDACFADAREWIVPIERDGRRIDYRIFTGRCA